jgi:hypothetical protein
LVPSKGDISNWLMLPLLMLLATVAVVSSSASGGSSLTQCCGSY